MSVAGGRPGAPQSNPTVHDEESLMPTVEPPGTLFCTLVDRRSSVPLSDARVTCVIGGGIVQVDVDTRGEFRADFPQGVFDLVISARGELSLTLRGVDDWVAQPVREVTADCRCGDAVVAVVFT